MQNSPTVLSIIKRFALISLISIGAFWLLRWLSIDYHIAQFNVKIWENAIPFLFPALPIFIFLKPEVKRANWANERARLTTLVIAYFGIVVPMKLSQEFMTLEHGKLQVVNSIDDIADSPNAVFCKVKNIALDRSNVISDMRIVTQDRSRPSSYECHVYVAVPIVSEAKSNSLRDLKYWLCIKSTQTYGDFTGSALRTSANNFHDQCVRAMQNYRPEQINYFSSMIGSQDFDVFESIVRTRSSTASERRLLAPQATPFKKRTDGSLAWVFIAYILAAGALAITLIFPRDY